MTYRSSRLLLRTCSLLPLKGHPEEEPFQEPTTGAKEPRQATASAEAAGSRHGQHHRTSFSNQPCFADTEEVTGSIPVPPTKFYQASSLIPAASDQRLPEFLTILLAASQRLAARPAH